VAEGGRSRARGASATRALRAYAAILDVELRALARDRRALFSAIFLPALLYPLVFAGHRLVDRVTHETLELREVRVALDLDRAPPDCASRLRELIAREGPAALVDVDASELVEMEPAVQAGGLDAIERQRMIVQALLATAGGADALLVARVQDEEPRFALRPYYDGTDDASNEANRRVARALSEIARELRDRRMRTLVGADPARGLAPVPIDTASAEDKSGAALGRLLPLVAVLVLLSGASYAALSAFAGERENGTLETLLVQPVPALAIVAAKFTAVLAAALATLLVNAASALGCIALGLAKLPGSMPIEASGAPGAAGVAIGAGRLALAALAFLPAALFLCAVLCALCGRARTFRQGQQMLLPLMLVALMPALLATQPEVETDALLAAVPLVGPALALRDALRGAADGALVAWMFAANAIWSAIALVPLARALDAERSLASFDVERESAERRIQSRYALRFGAVAVFLVYMAGSTLQVWQPVWGLLITLWVLLPVLAILSARGTARRAREPLPRTLSLGAPAWHHAIGAVLLAPALARAVEIFFEWQKSVLPLPSGYEEIALPLELRSLSPLASFLVLALSPAVCEELFCRGALLSGLKRDLGIVQCIVYDALVFGAMHASIERFAPTALVGAVLTAVALRSRSVWPCVALHAAYNAVLLGGEEIPRAASWFAIPALVCLAIPAGARSSAPR
jgi:sodium transport system permease protein